MTSATVATPPKTSVQPKTHSLLGTSKTTSLATLFSGCVLIVTATKIEAQAVLKTFSPKRPSDRMRTEKKTYYDLGIHGGTRVCMVQSEMGVATPSGALLTVDQAIHDLKPSVVIMSGIAFGLRPDKQKLGDILVAKQLLYYESQKVDIQNGQMPRGDRSTASQRLLDRFRTGDIDWVKVQTHFGLVLSGEKLVNDPAFLNWLRETEPEAIGGEMEGAGLYAAAHFHGKEWILVKGVCDWADGEKNDNAQSLAAKNAAQFVLHVLELGGLSGSDQNQEPAMADSVDTAQLGAVALPKALSTTSGIALSPQQSARTILFADNNADFRKTRVEVLVRAGYGVIEASDPLETRQMLEKEVIHLAIIDVRLRDDDDPKDETGLQLAANLAPTVPKILITQFSLADVRKSFRPKFDRSRVAVDFLSKSDGPMTMLDMVRDVLQNPFSGRAASQAREAVFVTHGHDMTAKRSIENFLLRGGVEPVVLQDRPSMGEAVIEKLERYAAEVSFAIVLLTPDDIGYLQRSGAASAKARARQNVIFELGYFLARLGRRRVRALVREGVEIPTNYSGVIYIPMDDHGEWERILARELRAAGIGIDLDRVI